MIKIPRGALNHNINDEIKNLINSFFYKLDNQEIVNKFEERFADYNERNFCCTFPFARTAFYYSIKTLGIKKGSEVIMSPITIKPILDVILELGLKPIFCDLNLDTLCYDEAELKKKINQNTKLIILTYLFGMVPEFELYSKLKKNEVLIIEDFSQCLNGKFQNKRVGTLGDISIYSSSSIKTLDTYGGGLLVTNKKTNFLKNLKFKKGLNANPRIFLLKKILLSFTRNFLSKKPFFYLVILTFRILSLLGFEGFSKFVGARNTIVLKKIPNIWLSSFTSLQAYYGSNLIKKIAIENHKRVKNVKIIKDIINKNFFTEDLKKTSNVYWQFPFINKNSKKIQKEALKNNIDIASPSIQILSRVIKKSKLKKAEKIYDNLILIPSYHTLKKEEIFKIGLTLKKICQKL